MSNKTDKLQELTKQIETLKSDLIELQDNYNKLEDEYDSLIIEFHQWKKESIKWSVEDFLMRAKDRLYLMTRQDAQTALEEMISKHDAEHGICWQTLDFYIDKYCNE